VVKAEKEIYNITFYLSFTPNLPIWGEWKIGFERDFAHLHSFFLLKIEPNIFY
jgi:hypothetical protein